MVRIRSPDELIKIFGLPVIDRYSCNYDLRENIEGILHDLRRLDIARSHCRHDCGDLHCIVTERRHQYSTTRDAQRVSCASNPLQRRRDAFR